MAKPGQNMEKNVKPSEMLVLCVPPENSQLTLF